MFGCSSTTSAFTEKEAQKFEAKLKNAEIEITQIAYPDGIVFKKGMNFLGLTIKSENIDFGESLTIEVDVSGLSLDSSGEQTFVFEDGETKIVLTEELDSIHGGNIISQYGSYKKGESACLFTSKDYKTMSEERKCNDLEVDEINEVKELKDKYLESIQISENDMFRYIEWYAKKELPAYNGE